MVEAARLILDSLSAFLRTTPMLCVMNVLQCVAVCYSVLHCIAVRCSEVLTAAQLIGESPLQCVAACCSVLQRVAVCCSALHREKERGSAANS